MAPLPMLLDCDPGHDDMVAILLAAGAPEIDLRAITTVAGNGTLEAVTRNALLTLDLGGIVGVPVAAGAAGPLLGPLQTAPQVHGESALDGAELGEPRGAAVEATAVELMAEVLRAATEPVALVAVGPLTNVALLLRTHPELREAIGRIVAMGGSAGAGNVAPLAEFNVLCDPEAAHVVLHSGVDVTLCPLDVTHQALAAPEVLAGLTALGTPLARTVVELLGFFADRYRELWGFVAAPVHDPVAVACVLDPGLVGTERVNVEVELRGEHTRGATVIDRAHVTGRAPNAEVAFDLDAAGFWRRVTAAVERLGGPR